MPISPTTPITTPQVDTQKTLWANANETLIAPQLLLITEPNTTIITTNNNTTTSTTPNDPVELEISNNNNNNNDDDEEEESNLAEVNGSNVSPESSVETPKSVQAPKSPPRWPLRPGVMLHVSRDTKQNLAVNRMTLKPDTIDRKSSSNNTSIISENSGVIFTSSPLRSKQTALALNFDAVGSLEENVPVENKNTNNGKFERRVQQFLINLFRRAKGVSSSDSTRDSQRSHVGLLSGMIFGRRQPNESQFQTQHRLKGIRCSGSVTYKKTHLLNKTNTTTSDTTVPTTTITTTTTTNATLDTNSLTLNNTKNSSYIINHIITQTAMTSSSQVPPPPEQAITMAPLLPHPPPPPPPPPPPVKRPVQRSASCGHSKQSPAYAIYPTPCCSMATQAHNTLAKTKTSTVTAVVVQSVPNTPKQLGMHLTRSGSQSAGNTPMRSILKNRSPPPMAPPRSKVKTISHNTPAQMGVVQMQEKSSTMGDLLTEPGEYENLPFHGLQTAPNKSNFTTPTDFNNDSSHVVLVAPRPKRLTNGQIHQEHKQRQKLRPEDFDIIERYDQIVNSEIQQQQQQQQKNQQQQLRYQPKQQQTATKLQGVLNDRMMEVGLPVSSTSTNTMVTMKIGEVSSADCEIDRRVMNTHRIPTNLNNYCSKSYTEYYQQQQQQQQKEQEKYNANISGLPSYAVIDQYHQERIGVTANTSTNPFLAISNFKKFDADNCQGETLQHPHHSHQQDGNNKSKSVLSFLARQDASDSKFYTLKLPGRNKNHQSQNKSSFGIFRFNTSALGGNKNVDSSSPEFMINSALEQKPSLKCKRHHSFTGGGIGDIDSVGRLTLQRNMAVGYGGNYTASTMRRNASGEVLQNTHAFEQYDTELLPPQLKAQPNAKDGGGPFYENLNANANTTGDTHDLEVPDSSSGQNYISSSQSPNHYQAKSRHHIQMMSSHFDPTSATIGSMLQGPTNRKGLRKQKQRRQRRHQQRDDLNLGVIEAERLSIYRSDSGISNSSYECVTPIPGLMGMSRAHIGSTPPPHKANKKKMPKSGSHKMEAPFHVASVLTQKRSLHEELDVRNVSPVPTLINSSYESASSSQIDGNTANTDPLSISSGNDSMALNRSRNCLRHQRPSDLKTLDDFEQYRLGHNYGHSVSFLDQINCQNIRDTSPTNKQQSKTRPQQATLITGTSTTTPPPTPTPTIKETKSYEDRLSVTQTPTYDTSTACSATNAFQNLVRVRWRNSQQQQQQQQQQEQIMINQKSNVNNSSSSSSSNFSKLAYNFKASPFMMMMLQKAKTTAAVATTETTEATTINENH